MVSSGREFPAHIINLATYVLSSSPPRRLLPLLLLPTHLSTHSFTAIATYLSRLQISKPRSLHETCKLKEFRTLGIKKYENNYFANTLHVLCSLHPCLSLCGHFEHWSKTERNGKMQRTAKDQNVRIGKTPSQNHTNQPTICR